MNDEELEALLESTRPRGPSPELRARILARPAVATTKRAWPWAAAAAALLVATLLLQSAAAGLRHGVRDANAAAATDSEDIENELTVAWRDSGNLTEADARLLAMAHEAQMRIESEQTGDGASRAMSGTAHIRRGFRRLVLVLLILLLPIAAWSLWDYVEARRLSSVVREVQAHGEPVTSAIPRVPAQFHSSAGAYYDAAALLMDRRALSEVEQALRYERGERAALIARLRNWLEANRDADRLLDQATAAEFTGFQAYQDYLRWDRLMKVSSLARARVVVRLEEHDGDGAANALIRQVRIARAMEATASDWVPFFVQDRALTDLGQVLETRPPAATLERLQQEIRAHDRDGVIHDEAVKARGLLIESLWNPGNDWYGRPSVQFSGNPLEPLIYFAARPWQAHRVTSELRRMNVAVAASAAPWPDRLKFTPIPIPTISASRWRFLDSPADTIGYLHQQRVLAFGRMLATLRTAECAVAVERFRAAHGGALPATLDGLVPGFIDRVPIDPFSGAPLKLRRSSDSYAVYSVGGNFTDDGGTALKAPRTPATGNRERPELAPDYGVAVALEPRKTPG